MNSPLDPYTSSEQFVSSLRELMHRRHLTYRDLSHELNLSLGTVQNWFCGGKPIPEKHRLRIMEILETPENVRLGREETAFIAVVPQGAPYTDLWCSAAGVPQYDFTQARLTARFTERCAGWCTAEIMGEVGRVLQGMSDEEALALRSRLPERHEGSLQDQASYNRERRRRACILEADPGAADRQEGTLYIPVLASSFKELFVRIAVEAQRDRVEARTSTGAFILSCLNKAAMATFRQDLENIRRPLA